MISFTDRLQLEREFYEWTERNHVLTDPFTVITWLLEVKGAILGNRIRTINSRREVETEILKEQNIPREYFENDLLRTMLPELKKVAVIKEVPGINPDFTAFACRLKVVLPEDLFGLRVMTPEVEK